MKRFSDTELWNKAWFMELLPAEKLAWLYITSACDNVGVWSPNFKLADFVIGTRVKWNDLIDHSNGNIKVLESGEWWLVDFCRFQHPDLNEDSTSPAIQSYVALLKKHGIFQQYVNSTDTVVQQYKEKEREQEEEKEEKEADILALSGKIKQAFYDKQADKTVFVFKKEVPACKALARKALTHDKPEEFINRLMDVFLKKTQDTADKFYSSAPYLPSMLNSSGVYAAMVKLMGNGRTGPKEVKKWTCPECGTVQAADIGFCMKCGKDR